MSDCTEVALRLLEVSVASLASLGAFGAAVGAFLSARHTRTMVTLQAFLDVQAAYSSTEVHRALRKMRELYEHPTFKDPEKFAEVVQDGSKYSEVQDYDEARRHVKFYFFRVYRAAVAGAISREQVASFVHPSQMNMLLEVLRPYEEALRGERGLEAPDRKMYEYFEALDSSSA